MVLALPKKRSKIDFSPKIIFEPIDYSLDIIRRPEKSSSILGLNLLKILSLILVILLNWQILPALGQTLNNLLTSINLINPNQTITIDQGPSPTDNILATTSVTSSPTFIGFSDEETATSTITDGTLDFRMTYDCDNGEDVITDFTPTNPIVRNHTVYQEGTLGFQYQVQPLNFSGNLNFCNQLMLTADLGGLPVYAGPLVDFYYSTVFSSSTYLWLYTLTLPVGLSAEYHHQTCDFTAVYYGWQENVTSTDLGFYDVEKNHYTITSGEWSVPNNNIVINEVYYDVDEEHGSERESQTDEWVELYNNSDTDINLKDWTLTDNNSQVSISHRNVILPAHQFAVLAKAAQTWTYWNIPTDAIKIELGQQIGDGLDNEGDRVILKDNNEAIIDMMSYGSDTFAFDPSVPDVSEGHSVARHPAGFDTDQASDWEDLTVPNPGTNPHPNLAPIILPLESNNESEEIINSGDPVNQEEFIETPNEPESINPPIIEEPLLNENLNNNFDLDPEPIIEEQQINQENQIIEEPVITENQTNASEDGGENESEKNSQTGTAPDEPPVTREEASVEMPALENTTPVE